MMTPDILLQLIHLQGGLKGEIQEFSRVPITVGRLSSCTVKFPPNEPAVSRQHATIQREGNRFKLLDHSKFGTFINGKLVDEAFLRNGDVLEFGPGGPKVSVTFEVVTERPSPAAEPMAAARVDAAPAGIPPGGRTHAAPSVAGAERSSLYQPLSPLAYSPPQRRPPEVLSETVSVPADSAPQFSAPPYAAVPKAAAPLVIQLGPTIRSYRELPVTIGAHDSAEFVLARPGILDHHAQIFFQDNSYWIKDLTGEGAVTVNRMAIRGAVQLAHNDEILCSRQGPTFRFLGGGRLAEVAARHEREAGDAGKQAADGAAVTERGGLFSKLLQRIRGNGPA